MFAITRFSCIKVIFHVFYYHWGKQNLSFYPGLCYIEVCLLFLFIFIIIVIALFIIY